MILVTLSPIAASCVHIDSCKIYVCPRTCEEMLKRKHLCEFSMCVHTKTVLILLHVERSKEADVLFS